MSDSLSAKDLSALRDAFVAEFGQHAAENSTTGRLLGLAPEAPSEAVEPEPEV